MFNFEKSFEKTIKIKLTNATEILTCEIITSPYDMISLAELYELINDYEVKPDYIVFKITIQLKQTKTLKFISDYKREQKKIVLDFFNPTYLENEIVLIFDGDEFMLSKKISECCFIDKPQDPWWENVILIANPNKVKGNDDLIGYKGSVFQLSSLNIFANYLLCDIVSNNNFEINGVKINAFMNPVSRILKGNFVEVKYTGKIIKNENDDILEHLSYLNFDSYDKLNLGNQKYREVVIRIYGYY